MIANYLQRLLENPPAFLQWCWIEPSWINLSYGDMLILGSLIGFGIIVGVINKIRTGDSGFF